MLPSRSYCESRYLILMRSDSDGNDDHVPTVKIPNTAAAVWLTGSGLPSSIVAGPGRDAACPTRCKRSSQQQRVSNRGALYGLPFCKLGDLPGSFVVAQNTGVTRRVTYLPRHCGIPEPGLPPLWDDVASRATRSTRVHLLDRTSA
jgi:hypothetical protein